MKHAAGHHIHVLLVSLPLLVRVQGTAADLLGRRHKETVQL